MLGQLFDRIAAIEQFSLLSVDITDVGHTTRCAHEARIVSEHIGLGYQSPDIEQIRSKTTL